MSGGLPGHMIVSRDEWRAARDAVEEVARGKHNRFVVGIEKTAQRLKAKLAKATG